MNLVFNPFSESYFHSTNLFTFTFFSAVFSNVIPVFIVNCGWLRSTKSGKLKSFLLKMCRKSVFWDKNSALNFGPFGDDFFVE